MPTATWTKPVGFLGTGLLGAPMVSRLLTRGIPVTLWNRTARKTEPLRDAGATVAGTPREAIGAAEVTALMLSDTRAIRDVVFAAKPPPDLTGRTILQMGTIGPDESIELASDVRAAGGAYVEAPVLGSRPQATAGELQIMFGGRADQLARWAPLLEVWGPVTHVGPVGSAATLKLALNQLIASLTTAFAGSLSLVRAAGVDVEQFMEILRRSALYAPTFDKKLPRLVGGDFRDPNFPTAHLLKDVDLYRQAATARGIPTDAVDGVRAVVARAIERGFGALDYSALGAALDPSAPLAAPRADG